MLSWDSELSIYDKLLNLLSIDEFLKALSVAKFKKVKGCSRILNDLYVLISNFVKNLKNDTNFDKIIEFCRKIFKFY